MSNQIFQNNTADLNSLWYYSHKSLLEKVANYLDASDKIPELMENILGTKLKIKKQRDPLKPKRGKTSFLFFCDEHRPIIRKKNPSYSMSQVMKELGVLWGNCKENDKEKAKYVSLSNSDRDRYEEELEQYQLSI